MEKEEINKICEEIFIEQNDIQISKEEMEGCHKLFGEYATDDYMYILGKYANVPVHDEYGFKGIEYSAIADENGYDSFWEFIGLDGKYNLFAESETFKDQLPDGYIPIGHMDGGNLLCMNNRNGYIYTWIHDAYESLHLVRKSFGEFITCIEKMPENKNKNKNIGIVEAELSEDFFKL